MSAYGFDTNDKASRHIVSAILTAVFYAHSQKKSKKHSEPDFVVSNYWKVYRLLGQDHLKPDAPKK